MVEQRTWVLTDVHNRAWVDDLELNNADLGLEDYPGVSIRKQTLHGGLCDGVDIVEVNNRVLSFTVVPTRGMNVWQGRYGDVEIGWHSPVIGPVNPKFVNAVEKGGLGWIGGFDECVTRCGLESFGVPCTDTVPDNRGNPAEIQLTLHGRVANIPAHFVSVGIVPGDPPEICVSGVVDEAMLFFPQLRLSTEIRTKPGSNSWTMKDRITNRRAVDQDMQILYHCNFGAPFLEEGSELLLPVRETAPSNAFSAEEVEQWAVYNGPTPGQVEQCYFHQPLGDNDGNGIALLKSAGGDKGVAVRFNANQLPCFTQWKNCAAWSDGYVTGLEPGTSYPNARPFEREQGRLVKLGPGDAFEAEVAIETAASKEDVNKIADEIAAIQGDIVPKVHGNVPAGYAPAEG